MLYIEKRDFDIGKGDKEPSPLVPICLREGENDGTKIIGTIYDGPQPLNVSGYNVTFKMTNPAKMYVDVPGTIESAVDGKVSVVVNHDMTDYRGPVQVAYFELTKGNEIVTTNNVDIKILASNDLDSGQRAKYQTTIDKLVEQLTELTRTFKDLENIQVTYKAGSSGTTAPTGSYTTTIPTVGQGEFLWARIQVNYSNGTNQVFYMMARQGKDNVTWGVATSTTDGLMSSADKRKLDGINDLSTDTNLLRGTQDFRPGWDRVVANMLCSDGFTFSQPLHTRKYIDNQGFTVVNMTFSGLTDAKWSSANTLFFVPSVCVGDYFTASFEFMVDDVSEIDSWSSFYIAFYRTTETTNDTYHAQNVAIDRYVPGVESKEIKSGVWYQCVIPLSMNFDAENVYGRFTIQLAKNGSIHFKKCCLNKGKINNPVYAPSPSDLALINDRTTGINLIRGSRDFNLSSLVWADISGTKFYYGGFENRGLFEFYKDAEGFTVAKKVASGQSVDRWYNLISVMPDVFESGEDVTISFEVMIEDVDAYDGNYIARRMVSVNKQAFTDVAGISFDQLGLNKSELHNGEWYKVKFVYQVPEALNENSALRVDLTCQRNGAIHFRKLVVQRGAINNPGYSVSPLDLALEPNNDITSEGNLIKFSRDLAESVESIPGYDSRPVNGWHLSADERLIGDDGFAYMHLTTQTGKDTCIRNLPQNSTYTLFFDFMCEGVSGLANKNILNLYALNTKLNATIWKIESINVSTLGVYELKDNVWHHLSYTFDAPELETDDWFLLVRFTYNKTSEGTAINFKKPGLYPGRIENPVWAPSPFDHVSSYGSPKLLGMTEQFPNGADLNEYKTAGSFGCYLSATAQTIKNKPESITHAFIMDVRYTRGKIDTGTNTQTRQTIIDYDINGETYTRFWNGAEWSPWRKTVDNQSIDNLWSQIAAKIESTYNVTKK